MPDDTVIVSVVIPAYNVAPFIADAIDSALNQTISGLEVIVVEDGATDDTPEVLRDFAATKNDPRLRIIHQQNAGLGEARNTGIKYATGKYIGFLDGDDLWRRNKLERHLASLEEDVTIAISYSHSEYMTEIGIPTGRYLLADYDEPTAADLIRRNVIGNGSAPVVRRDWLEKAGLFHNDCWGCEDWEMWCRILAIGGRAKLVPEILTLYRERPTSMTYDTRFVRGAEMAIKNLRTMLPTLPAYLFDNGIAEIYRIAALRALSRGAKLRATKYILVALHNYPKLMANWRTIGTLIGLVMPTKIRQAGARIISDLRVARGY